MHTPMSTYEILKNADFRRFISSRFFLTLSIQSQAVAVAWLVYSLTKDPLSLGLIGLAEVIPAVGFALVGGHIVDIYDRKKVGTIAQGLSAVTSIVLGLIAWKSEMMGTTLAVSFIYAAIFMVGVLRAFLAPSMFATLPHLVNRSEFVRATAWSTTVWQVAASLGPAIGGMLCGYVGATAAFLTSGILAACATYFWVRLPVKSTVMKAPKEEFFKSLGMGVRFVFSNQVMVSVMALDLFAVLFGGATALLPFFADLLKVGPQGFGLLRAAPTVGAFIMAFIVTHRPPSRRAGKILLASVSGFGVCMILFALSKHFYLSLFLLAVSGAFDAISVMVRSAVLQLSTPDQMRGRVAAVSSIFISSSNELGAFESGVVAKWMGLIPSVVFGGCMTIMVVLSTMGLAPKMRKLNLEKLRETQPSG